MHLRTSAFLLLLATSICSGQRHWLRGTDPSVGPTPQLVHASNALFLFDESAAVSYDHGNSWSLLADVASNCKAITEFVNGSVISFCQPSEGGAVQTFFSVGGSSWTQSDSLDLGGKHVVDATYAGNSLYIATNEGWLYLWTTKVDSSRIGSGAGGVRRFETTGTILAAETSAGLLLSTTNGTSWQVNNPPSAKDGLDVTTSITVHAGRLFASTDQGVFELMVPTMSWKPVGTWPAELTSPAVSQIAADQTRLAAMVRTEEGRHQMYVLAWSDTAWVPTAYEIPMDAPMLNAHGLAIDAGWAVTYQYSTVEPDSNGVFRYDLNDFTSVHEWSVDPSVRITSTADGIRIESSWEGAMAVDLLQLDGRQLYSAQAQAPSQTIPVPAHVRGLVLVVVRGASLKLARQILLR